MIRRIRYWFWSVYYWFYYRNWRGLLKRPRVPPNRNHELLKEVVRKHPITRDEILARWAETDARRDEMARRLEGLERAVAMLKLRTAPVARDGEPTDQEWFKMDDKT